MAARQKSSSFEIGPDRAYEHALLALRTKGAGQVPDFEPIGGHEVDPKPLVVHDLNGSPLFYDFAIVDGKAAVGTIRASASRLTAAPVMAIELGPRRWDPSGAERQARGLAKKALRRAGPVTSELVCYSYPKIGVRVRGAREIDSVLVDASSLRPVHEFGSDGPEGMAAWSYLDELGMRDAERRSRRWDLADAELEATRQVAPKLFARGLKPAELVRAADRLRDRLQVAVALYTSRVLRFGPRCSPHACFELYAQQTDVFCAVATGQMILDFYKYHFTQDDIAVAMNTGAGGTTNPDQVTGYETLSGGGLDATFDGSAAWAEARAEIDANRPCKSGIPGHARACAGWMRQNFVLIGQPMRRWLRIYDPWPWNADICAGGQVSWEDWDAVDHTNFIYVRHA